MEDFLASPSVEGLRSEFELKKLEFEERRMQREEKAEERRMQREEKAEERRMQFELKKKTGKGNLNWKNYV